MTFDLTAPATLKKLCFAFLTLGVLWRLARYALQFPIWGDEAFVCLNLLDQNYTALLGPLKCGQVAPLLFLWAELTAYQLLGGSEFAVRLIPLLAGLGSMFLFHRLAWRTLPPLAATFAVGILAVAYWPVAMSNTVKPYSLDLLMALALLVPAVEWLRQPDQSHWLTLLIGLCPLAIFSSYPAVFVAGAVSLACLPTLVHSSKRSNWLRYAALNVALVGAFLVHFGLVATQQLSPESGRLESYLQAYWSDGFPPATPTAFCQWVLRIHTGRMCAYPIGSSNGGSIVTTLLFVVGLARLIGIAHHRGSRKRFVAWALAHKTPVGRLLWAKAHATKNINDRRNELLRPNLRPKELPPAPRQDCRASVDVEFTIGSQFNRGLLLLLTAPFALNFVAAVLGKYPYGGCCRLSQHLAPAICLLAGWGVATLIEQFVRSSQHQQRWVAGLCLFLIMVPAVGMGRDFYRPYKDLRVLHARERLEQLFALAGPADRVIVLCPPEQVDPVHRWLLSQYGDRVQWDAEPRAPTENERRRKWGLDFRPSTSPDLEAMHFGQHSLQHAEVHCWMYQDGRLCESSRFALSGDMPLVRQSVSAGARQLTAGRMLEQATR